MLQTFHITGMDCADCARSIERGVRRLPGVEHAALHFSLATLQVHGEVAPERVIARVRELGYDVVDPATEAGLATAPAPYQGIGGFVHFLMQRRDTALLLAAALFILPGLLFHELLPHLGIRHPLFDLASVLALVLAGRPVARSAWRGLAVNRQVNINLLMTIAAAGAVVIGAYTEAGLVMVLFGLAEALESYTGDRARDAIRGLTALAPDEAVLLAPCIDCAGHLGQDGYSGGPCPFCGLEERRVPVAQLAPGDVILVRPGERIPMDGRIVAGQSSVNQAPITGESQPVEKQEGAEVFAGSVNGEGALQVTITRLAADNTLSRMIRLVEQAQEQRARSQRFVDRFASIYTPSVVALAALVAVIPPLLFAQPFWNPAPGQHGWLYRALALLVVACPCALVISTPVSLISAISNAARRGILIKGGIHLEALSRLRGIAFDKTGTLTMGRPTLVTVRAANCQDQVSGLCAPCDDLLALAAAVERHSEHPVAQAVVAGSAHRGMLHRYPAPARVQALAGQGVRGVVQGQDMLIGSHQYFDGRIPHDPHCQDIAAAAARGQTPLLVSAGDRYLGYLTVADSVRESSRAAISELKQIGIPHLVMLTGDDAGAAARIAAEVGVTDVRANLLPEQKVHAVRELEATYGAVAMVGDGINDAPALAASTVGVAMGAAASAQALETADVALMSDDLRHLPFAIRLSRAAMRTIYANVALSIGIKLAFLVLVVIGLGTMWMAVLADMGASLLVTLNGMRLLRWGRSQS